MPRYRARWVLPIAQPPVSHGWVETAQGRIVGLGQTGDPASADPSDRIVVDLGHRAVMPALVNAHTHLELSWLRGVVAPSSNLIDWITAQMRERIKRAADPDRVRSATSAAIAEMTASGTGVIGDVSNTLAVVDLVRDAGLAGLVFHELVGFNVPDPSFAVLEARTRVERVETGADLRVVLAPHAPYSVSAELVAALAAERADRGEPSSIHVAEGPEEIELLMTGAGRWRQVLEKVGSWNPRFVAPGCGPVEYLDRLGFWRPRTLAVHAVRTEPSSMRLLAARGATIVACPRSNRYVGAGTPPIEAFYASGASVAVGTDSLASVASLSIFDELAELRRIAPRVDARRLIESATRVGAEALGMEGKFGVLKIGAAAKMIAVEVPRGVSDVEEYLVGGISPGQVQWLEQQGGSC